MLNAPENRILLTFAEAAKAMGISLRTLGRLRNDPKFPVILIGPFSHRIPVKKLEQWIESQTNTGKRIIDTRRTSPRRHE